LSEYLRRYEYAPLSGKKIVLGLTASSAVYKSIDLARQLIRNGAIVDIVLTRETLKLIGADLVEWAVGRKPYVETTGLIEHIDLAHKADALVIAPATLKTMSRIAYGYTDELLPLLATAMLGLGKKVLVVPTMNKALYDSPQYRMIHERLAENNVYVLPVFIEEDRVKYPPINDLVHCIDALVNRGRDLEGVKAVVTAGPTREYIDPVRIITNSSTGYMGVLIARELACRGAEVDLVHGPLGVDKPYMVRGCSVETTAEMAHKLGELTSSRRYDVGVYAAAPSDFTVLSRSSSKIPTRESRELTLTLKPTIKVVKHISRQNKPGINIIFTAETTDTYEELVQRAREKINDYGADLAVANRVYRGVGFASEYIDACIVGMNERLCYGVIHKKLLARILVDRIKDMLESRRA
jgi:phosphopantothenoylcysteine decarboxylase/phosphopantothenate--cysteine ligase